MRVDDRDKVVVAIDPEVGGRGTEVVMVVDP